MLVLADDPMLLDRITFARTTTLKRLLTARPALQGQSSPGQVDLHALLGSLDLAAVDCILLAQSTPDVERHTHAQRDEVLRAHLQQIEQFIKTFTRSPAQRDLKLVLLNCGSGDAPDPLQSAASKYFSFLRYEHLELRSGILHVDVLDDASLGWIHRELSAETQETEVRLLAGKRFVQRLRRLEQESTSSTGFDPSGCMVVTGAFGGIGLALVGWLIERGVRELVLVGRKPLDSALKHPSLEPGMTIRAFLEGQRKQGVTLHYLQADMSEPRVLTQAFDAVRKELRSPITGVFHLAGVTTGILPVSEMTTEQLLGILGPKLHGAWALHAITERDPIRYFCLFSSISSVEGMQGFGLSAYGAANAALDALGAWRRRRGLPAQVVQWTDWSGAGMAVEHDHAAFFEAMGMRMLSPELGLAILDEVLTKDIAASIAFDVDWERYARANRSMHKLPFFEEYIALMARGERGERSERGTRAGQERLATPGGGGGGETKTQAPLLSRGALTLKILEQHLLTRLGALLELGDLDAAQSFSDLGLDSINSLSFFGELSRDLSLDVLPSVVFRHPTVAALAQHLLETLDREAARAEAKRGSSVPGGQTKASPHVSAASSVEHPAPAGPGTAPAPSTEEDPRSRLRAAIALAQSYLSPQNGA